MVTQKIIFHGNDEKRKGILRLEDGSEFAGWSFGAAVNSGGEVVFNTGMVGYPETLTDPSYRGQILVMTYPLVGNYGIPSMRREDGLLRNFESDKVHAGGLVVSDYSETYSHWNAERSLSRWLKDENVPALSGIDTRRLTKIIRSRGTMRGKIIADPGNEDIAAAEAASLVSQVSIGETVRYNRPGKRIVLVDCGVKNNIIRAFLGRNISVIRVPFDSDFLLHDAEGIVLSNGPGDPKDCGKTIKAVERALAINVPILGICLGCQILALASGADTYKLKYGHRGQNQPCLETGSKRCYITSQNHGYAVDASTLPEDWREWFVNDNDGTNEGIMHISKPFFGAQFHPEASPGPDDTEFIFDMFVRALR